MLYVITFLLRGYKDRYLKPFTAGNHFCNGISHRRRQALVHNGKGFRMVGGEEIPKNLFGLVPTAFVDRTHEIQLQIIRHPRGKPIRISFLYVFGDGNKHVSVACLSRNRKPQKTGQYKYKNQSVHLLLEFCKNLAKLSCFPFRFCNFAP